jgi:hypothetical protein
VREKAGLSWGCGCFARRNPAGRLSGSSSGNDSCGHSDPTAVPRLIHEWAGLRVLLQPATVTGPASEADESGGRPFLTPPAIRAIGRIVRNGRHRQAGRNAPPVEPQAQRTVCNPQRGHLRRGVRGHVPGTRGATLVAVTTLGDRFAALLDPVVTDLVRGAEEGVGAAKRAACSIAGFLSAGF